jgi:hypothetical protein
MTRIYSLLKARRGRSFGVFCGLSFAVAAACRPTVAVGVLAVGAGLLLADRKTFLFFCLGGAPVAAALGGYNSYYHGSPLSAGREAVDRRFASEKTGSPDLWQTPLWEGAAGLLFSPSRGLLIFSPFLLFSVGGFARAWTDSRFKALRPLTVAAVGVLLIASKWFDWWGGWCFGYRPIVDATPLLAVPLVPPIESVARRGWALLLFLALLTWSIAVQFIGAFAYDSMSWNARVVAYELTLPDRRVETIPAERADLGRVARENSGAPLREVRADIDQPRYRRHLWSVTDNQIFYCTRHFNVSRALRERQTHGILD